MASLNSHMTNVRGFVQKYDVICTKVFIFVSLYLCMVDCWFSGYLYFKHGRSQNATVIQHKLNRHCRVLYFDHQVAPQSNSRSSNEDNFHKGPGGAGIGVLFVHVSWGCTASISSIVDFNIYDCISKWHCVVSGITADHRNINTGFMTVMFTVRFPYFRLLYIGNFTSLFIIN